MVLMSRDRGVDWSQDDDLQREALCRKFPTPHFGADPWFDSAAEAMAVCNGTSGGPVCPMRQRCLKRAILNNESWGVWGGLLLHDRKAIKRANPDDPEAWLWQPPTAPTRRKRRRKTPTPSASPNSWPTAKPRAFSSPTSAPTSCSAPPSPTPTGAPTVCIPATSAAATGAREPVFTGLLAA